VNKQDSQLRRASEVSRPTVTPMNEQAIMDALALDSEIDSE
jgi:hypothetical protein